MRNDNWKMENLPSFRGVVSPSRTHLNARPLHLYSYRPESSGPRFALAVISQHKLRAHLGGQPLVDFVEITRFLFLIFVDRGKECAPARVFAHCFHDELARQILYAGRWCDSR